MITDYFHGNEINSLDAAWRGKEARVGNGVLGMRAWGITHRGAVREENQDAFHFALSSGNMAFGVVCDGMGGARGGNVASRMAVDCFAQQVLPALNPGMEDAALRELLNRAAELANEALYKRSREDSALCGMGTTLVATVVEQNRALVLNVGDSRAYHLAPGAVTRLTNDHSVVEDMVKRGKITPEQARIHPQKHLITRALGADETVECDLFAADVVEGDFLLLCSDGLVNVVSDQEILYEVLHGGEPDHCCERLLQITLSRGAPDNVTVLLFQI